MEIIKIDSLLVEVKVDAFHRWYHCNDLKLFNKPSLKLLTYTFGLFVGFIYSGIMQEDLVTDKYGKKEEIISHALAMKCCESIMSAIIAANFSYFTGTLREVDSTKPIYYISISVILLLSKCCEVTALNYINYQALVIVSSCQPLPVMIFGSLIARTNYKAQKYLFVSMIILGEIVFIFEKSNDSQTEVCQRAIVGPGELLIIGSLLIGGICGAIQDKMRADHQPKWNHMMFSVSLWSTLFGGFYLLVTNKGVNFINFLQKYPKAIIDIGALSLACSIGQIFVYKLITEFGTLVFCIITTIRKLCTLVASSIFFGYVMNSCQIFGTALVFLGITLDSVYGKCE